MQTQALEFDALFEEEHNWFQKSVAEVLSWDVNQNPIDLLPMQCIHESCADIVFWTKRRHVLDVLTIFWTLKVDAFCTKRNILPKHAWIMRYHVFWYRYISFCSSFSIVWHRRGDLRSHGVLHIWDDCFFSIFHFRAAFTMGEEVGVTFPSSWGA